MRSKIRLITGNQQRLVLDSVPEAIAAEICAHPGLKISVGLVAEPMIVRTRPHEEGQVVTRVLDYSL